MMMKLLINTVLLLLLAMTCVTSTTTTTTKQTTVDRSFSEILTVNPNHLYNREFEVIGDDIEFQLSVRPEYSEFDANMKLSIWLVEGKIDVKKWQKDKTMKPSQHIALGELSPKENKGEYQLEKKISGDHGKAKTYTIVFDNRNSDRYAAVNFVVNLEYSFSETKTANTTSDPVLEDKTTIPDQQPVVQTQYPYKLIIAGVLIIGLVVYRLFAGSSSDAQPRPSSAKKRQ
jgi:hypothetical protein